MRPAKTQISLGIRQVWSVFAVRMRKPCTHIYPLSAHRRLWSDWADAQADLNLRWAHSHFVGFVVRRLHYIGFRGCRAAIIIMPYNKEKTFFYNVSDFNCRNKALATKLLRHTGRKTFSKFYRRHSELVEKYNVSLKKLLQQGISEPEFHGDLVYRIRTIVEKSNFSEQFRRLINLY